MVQVHCGGEVWQNWNTNGDTRQVMGMREMALIALLTDFGAQDTYVGVMKGVIAGTYPDARFIDLTHNIAPQDIRQGALALLTSYQYFPLGTVFLVVVDPGVGSARNPLAVQAGGYFFIGPDNGVLSYALRHLVAYRAHLLTSPEYRLPSVSQTFHGRDIFAPAAAHLAAGGSLVALGTQIERVHMLPEPMFEMLDDHVAGEVIHIDHYGNIITSIGLLTWGGEQLLSLSPAFGKPGDTAMLDARTVRASIGGAEVIGVQRHYAAAAPGTLLVLVGSSGFLEFAINQGHAAGQLGVVVGERVTVQMG